jgi:hypothetical protein
MEASKYNECYICYENQYKNSNVTDALLYVVPDTSKVLFLLKLITFLFANILKIQYIIHQNGLLWFILNRMTRY